MKTIVAATALIFMSFFVNPASAANLKPGDVLTLNFPGETAFDAPFQIDRSGYVTLPEVGRLKLAGRNEEEAETVIWKALSPFFRNINSLKLEMKERRLLLSVLGFVKAPGRVELHDGAAVQDAIMAAGGLKAGAQLDKLQIRRGGQTLSFDFKNYLVTGNTDLLPALKTLDVVFIPASPLTGNVQVDFDARTLTATGDGGNDGSAVEVFGEVHRPGSFAWKSGMTVMDALMRAGGVTRYAGVDQIRIVNNKTPSPFNLREFLDTAQQGLLPTLSRGAIIFVPRSEGEVTMGSNAIRIIGAVHKAGRFEWFQDMSILDLIAFAGGTKPDSDISNVQVLTTDGKGKTHSSVFNLKNFLEKGGELSSLPILKAGDTVMVPRLPSDPNDNRSQWVSQSSERSIYVFGQVGAPGRYAFNANLSFLDILSAAQGPTAEADLRNVQITHRGEKKARTTKLNLALYFKTGDENLLPEIRTEDVIYIPERNSDWRDISKDSTIRVLGSVGRPGRFKFDDQMTILDLLAEAGGPTKTSMPEKIVVVTQSKNGPRSQLFDLIAFAKDGDYTRLPVLRNGDTVYVPSMEQSDWNIFRRGLKDVLSVLSVFALLAAL